mmetsp:Transcript_41971/g.55298  ORF Transcript_41971/g.55298 Transcript_41971/m.55298 type:complete len:138 (+) Transcript_41971:734-1147(+)
MVPQSARATFFGRATTTKNSQDFKKVPLLDIPPSRNGKPVGANESFNYLPAGSLYNSAMLAEGELKPLPRRKTVGFRDISLHRKLSISEKCNCDESRNPENNTTVVMIDDVESRQSRVLFDKESESELQHSSVKDES